MPQPGTAQVIDSMGPFTMYRLAYRNYGSHESLVVNHTVALDGNPGLTSQTGIRWYELRAPGADAPVVYQRGTAQSPVDGQFQFMASMAMDRQGNIGMGYSSSSTTLFRPSTTSDASPVTRWARCPMPRGPSWRRRLPDRLGRALGRLHQHQRRPAGRLHLLAHQRVHEIHELE